MRPNPFSLGRNRSNNEQRMSVEHTPPVVIDNGRLEPIRQSSRPLPFQSRGKATEQDELEATNMKQQKYLIIIKDIVNSQDLTLAASVLLTQHPGQKKKFIEIERVSSYLLDYPGGDFPNNLALACPNMDGYFNANGQSTHFISVSQGQIVSSTTKAGMTVSNIFYDTNGSNLWDVTGMTQLDLIVCATNSYKEPISMPLENPITLLLKIIRVVI